MAKLLGYDLIAVTDHNTCENCASAVQAGERAGLCVVPGMELCTSEEAHVVCLFPDVPSALGFSNYVRQNMPDIKNRPDIFGPQMILDADDTITGEEERLLLVASFISVSDVMSVCARYGGAAFPAHVDKDSYSVIAALGVLPAEAGFYAAEITHGCRQDEFIKKHPELQNLLILRNSDAHYLENMPEPSHWVDLPEVSPNNLIQALMGQTQILCD
jgi:hypothetical protein